MAILDAVRDLQQRFRGALSTVGLFLVPSAGAPEASGVTLISGAGAPVNGTTTVPTDAGVYYRTDPASADTLMYVTINGGTNWTAAVLAS